MLLPPSLTALAARQGGCVAHAQAVAIPGVTRHHLRWWREQGWLRAAARGVVRIAGAPVGDDSRLWAAVLRAGEGALAGATATCWLFGLEGFERLEVDVVVPAPRRCRGAGSAVRTRTLSHIDRVVVRGFPALSVERAVIELAARLPEKELRVLIDSARRRGLLRIPRLRERAVELRSAAGSRRGSRAVLDLIGSGALAQESEAEREAARFLSTTTLELMWQVEDLVEGRRFDAVDHAARLILEIDSQLWHSLGSDRDADGLRDLETSDVAPGYVVVRLTLGMIRHHPDETRRRLDAIRGARLQSGR